MYFTSNNRSQITFVYQPTLDTLDLKKDKGTDYIFSWKSKGVYTSKLKPLFTDFLLSIKLSGYRMGIKFDKDPLAVEQNNWMSKIVNVYINVYIVYDLDAWPRNPTNNFKFRNCLFGSTSVAKNSDIMNSVQWLWNTFNNVDSWSVVNDIARNVIFFGVDNSSSSYADNPTNNFLVLGKGPTFGINGKFGSPEIKFRINFSKANTKFALVYIIMLIIAICLLMKN